MEETFKEIGQLRLLLETATRLRDWELCQSACEDLAHQYSFLKLEVKQQKEESR